MKEKIYKYLAQKKGGVTSKEIIEKFFKISNYHPPQMESIVESMLMEDNRFVRDEIGEWHINEINQEQNLESIIFTIAEFESIPINQKIKMPIMLGILQVQNFKLIYNQLFSLKIPDRVSNLIQQQIDQKLSKISLQFSFTNHAEEIFGQIQQSILISRSPFKILSNLNDLFRSQIGLELELKTISLVNIARKLFPGIKIRSIEDIAEALSISFLTPLDLSARLDLVYEIFTVLVEKLEKAGLKTIEGLQLFLEEGETWVDFAKYNFNRDYIKNLPITPGVYLMKDVQERIFYVGKAKNLKERIKSYFINRLEMDEKGREILTYVYDLIYEQTGSELDALLLENKYINKYKPSLNTQVKIHLLDMKRYKTKRIILFLPGLTEQQIVIYLMNGTEVAKRAMLNSMAYEELCKVKNLIKRTFFNFHRQNSDLPTEQIEIIWRWFSVNYESVNFIDIDQCGSIENCYDVMEKYCRDKNLFSEKIVYR